MTCVCVMMMSLLLTIFLYCSPKCWENPMFAFLKILEKKPTKQKQQKRTQLSNPFVDFLGN